MGVVALSLLVARQRAVDMTFDIPPVTQLDGYARISMSVRLVQNRSSEPLNLFVAKRGMVVHHRGAECHAKWLGCRLQRLDHSAGLYNRNMTVSKIYSELITLCNQTYFSGRLS